MIRTSIFALLAAAMTFAAEGVNTTVNASVDSHIGSVSVKLGSQTLTLNKNQSASWTWTLDSEYTILAVSGVDEGYTPCWKVSTNNVEALSGGTNNTITIPNTAYQGHPGQDFAGCSLRFYGEPSKYFVTLDRQSGNGGDSRVTATYAAAMPSMTKPTRAGYEFGGYYTDVNGGGIQYYTASGDSARNWDIAADTTLYAKWTAISHSVTFDPRGGTLLNGWTQSTNYLEVSGLTLPTAADVEKADCAFAGWYDNDALAGSPRTEIVSGTKVDMRFYAKWVEKTYTVLFNSNGGLGQGSQPDVSMSDTFRLRAFSDLALVNGFQAPTGYSFASWNTVADGSGSSFEDGAYVYSSLTNEANATVTLYAQWTPNQYEVAFQPNGADGGETMPSQSFTYDVTQALAAVEFTYAGRAFKGWSTVSNNPSVFYPDGAEVANLATGGVVNLYANWTNIVYTVAFNPNGGTGAMDPITCTYTVPTNLPFCTFARDGWGFTGWTNNLAEGVLFADHARVTNLATRAEEVYMYACWTGSTYSVVFDTLGDGVMTNGVGEEVSVLTNFYVVGDAWDNFPVPANVDTQHWDFAGWTYVDAQGVTKPIPAEVPPPSTGATNLVATWSWKVDDLAAAVDAPKLAFSTFGTAGAQGVPTDMRTNYNWFAQANFVCGSTNAAQSAELPVNTVDSNVYVSWLTTTVETNGVLSFWWRCDAPPLKEEEGQQYSLMPGWCGNSFTFGLYDSTKGITNTVAQLTDHADWSCVVYANKSDSPVTFAWAFAYADFGESNGGGTGWVDRVTWKSEGSASGEVTSVHAVPYSWLRAKFPAYESADAAALETLAESDSPNGKPMKVWQEYWAGTDPNDLDDLFRADIAVSNNVAYITWRPDLSVTGVPVRVYHLWSAPSPTAGWVKAQGNVEAGAEVDLAAPGASANRFFKVELDWEGSREE